MQKLLILRNMKITMGIIEQIGWSKWRARCRAVTQKDTSTTVAHSRTSPELMIGQQLRGGSKLKTRRTVALAAGRRYSSQYQLGCEEVETKQEKTDGCSLPDTHPLAQDQTPMATRCFKILPSCQFRHHKRGIDLGPHLQVFRCPRKERFVSTDR